MPRKQRKTTAITIRLTPEMLDLIRALAAHMGMSQSAMIEVLVRGRAKREGVR